jgi:hypothetical protein
MVRREHELAVELLERFAGASPLEAPYTYRSHEIPETLGKGARRWLLRVGCRQGSVAVKIPVGFLVTHRHGASLSSFRVLVGQVGPGLAWLLEYPNLLGG